MYTRPSPRGVKRIRCIRSLLRPIVAPVGRAIWRAQVVIAVTPGSAHALPLWCRRYDLVERCRSERLAHLQERALTGRQLVVDRRCALAHGPPIQVAETGL